MRAARAWAWGRGWVVKYCVYVCPVSLAELCIAEREPFSYPEPFLRAVNGARQGALAKSISNWHLIGYNEGYCSNCCRRQHTILNMKYCFYVSPVSLAELCIAERELDFVHVRMFVRMIRFMTYFDVTEI